MRYRRMIMEVESPEEIGYGNIACNLAESSLPDQTLGDLGIDLSGVVLGYGDHMGLPALREIVAADGRTGLRPEHVLVTAGAAGALFIAATAILQPGDHLVVVHPNYASNLETPRAIGARITEVPLQFETGYRLDLDQLASSVTCDTRLVSITTPHNPTGSVLSHDEIDAVIAIAERAGAWLLVDETYRELGPTIAAPIATRSSRVISVSSVSKTYGVPGIRIGWCIATDPGLMTELLAAKEQVALTHSLVDEVIAHRVLSRSETLLPAARARVLGGREQVAKWIADEPLMEWVAPTGGAVCFPRIVDGSGVDPVRFYRRLNEHYRTWVGPGHWFEVEPTSMRIGYGYPSPEDLASGLANISAALREAR